jgi:hypothetical protein
MRPVRIFTGGSVMRAVTLLFGLVAVFLLGGVSAGEQDMEVTINGQITCAKCDLGRAKECATIIIEKQHDKERIYYFDQEAHKKYHDSICMSSKYGTVVGTVDMGGAKLFIKVNKLVFTK